MKSPTITVRVNQLLLASMKAEIERYNSNPINEPHDITSFVNQAISEKIDHMKRGRSRKAKKPAA